MSISSALIKELREKSGAGMMDCKKALTENNGDLEAAADWLRKKGLSSAAKKSSRTAAEGLVAVNVSGNRGVAIELNSETDFVAKNDQFRALVNDVASIAISNSEVESLKNAELNGKTVQENITDLVGVIGENMQLRRVEAIEVNNGAVVSYIHNAATPTSGKIGVLVALESEGDKGQLENFGKQLAMHIAAVKPEALNVEDLDPSIVEREREIFKEQAKSSGKPDNIIEKMIEGRIRKFYSEVVLTQQVFVIDGKISITEAIQNAEKEIGSPIKLSGYVRFQLGEGIEKKQDNFAEEVAAAAGTK